MVETDIQTADAPYRVLARKYRPQTFADLIGQEAMVRTLSNAFDRGRIAQAYLLTGVRGIGKTTTARIIARALNCIGPDGSGGPTIQPCGVCPHCRDIMDDRDVDVVEMDAASNNSVDNIREITEAARYRPADARYKVYILDEAHMLSNAAFNALLKTLEEPPPHVKFIFATTEARRLPVTVLSRCQRFDLRRVSPDQLVGHFGRVTEAEGASAEDEALAMIARAADGSVRDGLSLLDQAIALAEPGEAVTAEQVRQMLGLADRLAAYDLFEAAMGGDASGVLAQFGEMIVAGADPAAILQDLLETTYWTTRLGVDPNGADFAGSSAAEKDRALALAKRLTLPVLTRAWQLLSKGHGETLSAPNPRLSAEMALIR
ncbi:MAG: DNA polymerase III subunit gamma/tau, partial [Alphaproteobacteria bacterium]